MMQLKTELHRRNRHKGQYDFAKLSDVSPDLALFIRKNHYGNESIDFTDPAAVKILNKAILKFFYGIKWDLPGQFLCPGIPGRADYVHYIADLLGASNKGVIRRGKQVLVLDVGVGANCIYPLIGQSEYGWSFIGTDIDPAAIAVANGIINQNGLAESIEIRLQKNRSRIFEGILKEGDASIDISMCNPPFHASLREATAGTQRKWNNLGVKTKVLNFGGYGNELWCPGGEESFIKRMIEESVHVNCKWFTTLVSKEASLPGIYQILRRVGVLEVRTIEMSQGQKKSRIVAWTFLNSR